MMLPDHEACARVLMDDYGVPLKLLPHLTAEIERIWHHIALHHSLIVLSVRGHLPNALTRELEALLDQHKTHTPKHRTPKWQS